MNTVVKIIIIFLALDLIVLAGYFGYKAVIKKTTEVTKESYEWIEIDEFYTPSNFVEEYIKNDSAQRGIFPVYIKNYGKNEKMLKKFRGNEFAGPSKAQLNMVYPGLEDWMLVEIKYKRNEREVIRAVLYVMHRGEWRVADSGSISER